MKEIEIKARITEEKMTLLETALKKRGFSETEFCRERDIYYNHPVRDFARTDEALRLRSSRDLRSGEKRAFLTYKGPSESDRAQFREELECPVEDFELMEPILKKLGLTPAAEVVKERRSLKKEGLCYCLDRVERLGCFVEIEVVCTEKEEAGARKRVEEEFRSLAGLAPVPETKTYLELLET